MNQLYIFFIAGVITVLGSIMAVSYYNQTDERTILKPSPTSQLIISPSLKITSSPVPSNAQTTYYGRSTNATCNSNSDCYTTGCNEEICHSKLEEEIFSICIVPDKPLPQDMGFRCTCIEKQGQKGCQWTK